MCNGLNPSELRLKPPSQAGATATTEARSMLAETKRGIKGDQGKYANELVEKDGVGVLINSRSMLAFGQERHSVF